MAEATVTPYSQEPLPQARPNSMFESSRDALAVIMRNRLAALGLAHRSMDFAGRDSCAPACNP